METDWELLFYRRVWLPVRLSNVNDCQIWSPLGTEDVREQNFGFCVDANDKHDDFIAFEIHRAFGVATILLFVADIPYVVLVVQRKSDAKHVHHGYDSHACILFAVGDDGVDRVDGRRPCAGFSRRALRARITFSPCCILGQSGVHFLKTPQWVEAAVGSVFGNPVIRAASNIAQPNEARRFVGRGRRLAD